jgi:hypothetical protein
MAPEASRPAGFQLKGVINHSGVVFWSAFCVSKRPAASVSLLSIGSINNRSDPFVKKYVGYGLRGCRSLADRTEILSTFLTTIICKHGGSLPVKSPAFN